MWIETNTDWCLSVEPAPDYDQAYVLRMSRFCGNDARAVVLRGQDDGLLVPTFAAGIRVAMRRGYMLRTPRTLTRERVRAGILRCAARLIVRHRVDIRAALVAASILSQRGDDMDWPADTFDLLRAAMGREQYGAEHVLDH